MAEEPEADWGSDFEVPPAIACAHCGDPECDGCAPVEDRRRIPSSLSPSEYFVLPWESDSLHPIARLIDSAQLTVHDPESVFGRLNDTSIWPALRFALWAELLAVSSFGVPWALGVFLVFPALSLHMLTTGSVLVLSASILFSLIFFVIFVHMAWGVLLEWAIKKGGTRPAYRLGLRLGLYACGWDLLTSPAGFVLLLPRGLRPTLRTIAQGARVPRNALRSYLRDRRGLSDEERKRAVWKSLWILGGLTLSFGLALFVLLLSIWIPVLFT